MSYRHNKPQVFNQSENVRTTFRYFIKQRNPSFIIILYLERRKAFFLLLKNKHPWQVKLRYTGISSLGHLCLRGQLHSRDTKFGAQKKNVHIIIVSVTSIERTPVFRRGKGHYFQVQNSEESPQLKNCLTTRSIVTLKCALVTMTTAFTT